MKKMMSLFLISSLIFPGLTFAKFRKDQKIILLEKVQEGQNVGSLEKLLDQPELSNKIKLLGQARMVKSPHSSITIVQMVWTGVQNMEGNKQVALEKPLISTFKFKNLNSTKGSQIAVEGELEILLKAVDQLEAGNIDKEQLKKKLVAKNPSKKGRFVDMDRRKKANEKDEDIHKSLQDAQSEVNQKSYSQYQPEGSLNTTNSSQSKKTSDTKRNYAESPQRGDNGQQLSGGLSMDGNHSSARQNGTALQQLGSIASLQNPSNSNNRSNGNPIIGVGQNQLAVDQGLQPSAPLAQAEEQVQGPSAPLPEMTCEVTEEGCQPKIDRVHERVTIRNRVRKLENGQVVEEGPCTDSIETYPIMKDYLCEGCTDEVNHEERKAYSRYQEYWFDRENQRQNIGDTIYADRSRYYDFFHRITHCPLSIDLEGRRVYTQRETGYLNRNNTFVELEACHRIPDQIPIPITETYNGCLILHDFVNGVSHDQSRLIFSKDNIEHEVRGCQQRGEAMEHQFVETGCQRAVDLLNNRITPMYRRLITVRDRFLLGNQPFENRIITDECEPHGDHPLQVTREGCENLYVHDLNMGRSYLKKRYYYQNNGREYVTGCVRVNDFIQHQTQSNGEWVHDDVNRASRPKLSIFINTNDEQGNFIIDAPRVRGDQGIVLYTLARNEQRATPNVYFEGCFRRTRTQAINIYNRADNSIYEHILGAGNPILSSIDECRRREETRSVIIGQSGGSLWRHSRPSYGTQRRIITTFPDGRVQNGEWHFNNQID